MGFLSWLWAYAVILRTGATNGNTSLVFFGEGDYCQMAGCLGCEPRLAQLERLPCNLDVIQLAEGLCDWGKGECGFTQSFFYTQPFAFQVRRMQPSTSLTITEGWLIYNVALSKWKSPWHDA